MVMPGLDGFSVCERLKADPRLAAVPVVFLTASAEVADKLRGFAVGGVDYITKPFSEQEVLARVAVHLDTRRRLERLENLAANRLLEGSASRPCATTACSPRPSPCCAATWPTRPGWWSWPTGWAPTSGG